MSTKTSSRQIKLHKKVKIGTGRSKSPKDDGEPLDSKKKGFRRNKNAEVSINDAADILYHDNKLYKKENGGRMNLTSKTQNKFVYGEILDSKKKGFRRNNNAEVSIDAAADILYHDKKLYKKENGGRMNVKSKTQNKFVYEQKNVGGMGSKPINYDRKLKRVYVDKIKEGMFHRNAETPNRRVLSKGLNELNHDMAKEKHILRGRSHGFEQLEKERLFKGERKPCETMSLDNNGHRKLRPRLKAVAKMESVKMNPSGSGSMMKGAKKKSDSRKKLDQYHNGCAAESIGKSAKKRICDKKSPSDDLEENGRPKKKKRTIQLDPRDITNKRLDDGVVTIGHTQEKKEVTEKNERAEMSKNAQFRAINPSPSILSFVEDNFLGRRRLIDLRRAGYNTELSAPLDNIPFSTSSERERIEESIFRNKLTFFAAANVSSSFPPPDLSEIAFAGRSNVGKSSLLNALTRQWGVVRTSDKPGLTQTINFFTLGSKLCLVDLPGYGFAYAKEDVKEAWEELVKEYISTRVGLKRVCLLIDTKWGMKPRDHELIDLMERSHTKYQIVLTKTDLVFPIDVARRAMQIEESLKAKKSAVPPVMMASSKSGAGIRSLRTVLSKIARFAKL